MCDFAWFDLQSSSIHLYFLLLLTTFISLALTHTLCSDLYHLNCLFPFKTMAEFQHAVQPDFFLPKQVDAQEIGFVPYWARSQVQYAQNLLECSDEPIVYDDEDEDYQDNCFFFPEDCSWSPPKDWVTEDNTETETETDTTGDSHTVYSDYQNNYDDDDDNDMIPGLPDIKMLDAEALRDLLEDNLSPPEITSIL